MDWSGHLGTLGGPTKQNHKISDDFKSEAGHKGKIVPVSLHSSDWQNFIIDRAEAQSIARIVLCDAGKLRDVTLQTTFDSTTFSGRYRHVHEVRGEEGEKSFHDIQPLKEPKAKRAKVRKTTPIQSRTAGTAFAYMKKGQRASGFQNWLSRFATSDAFLPRLGSLDKVTYQSLLMPTYYLLLVMNQKAAVGIIHWCSDLPLLSSCVSR
ncbi:hypothetical protein C8J56DRAFT_909171 [Mycena floridula]|nr:hypothetical protein C8J56DRAFT_909171 [Mycena floridula]